MCVFVCKPASRTHTCLASMCTCARDEHAHDANFSIHCMVTAMVTTKHDADGVYCIVSERTTKQSAEQQSSMQRTESWVSVWTTKIHLFRFVANIVFLLCFYLAKRRRKDNENTLFFGCCVKCINRLLLRNWARTVCLWFGWRAMGCARRRRRQLRREKKWCDKEHWCDCKQTHTHRVE